MTLEYIKLREETNGKLAEKEAETLRQGLLTKFQLAHLILDVTQDLCIAWYRPIGSQEEDVATWMLDAEWELYDTAMSDIGRTLQYFRVKKPSLPLYMNTMESPL